MSVNGKGAYLIFSAEDNSSIENVKEKNYDENKLTLKDVIKGLVIPTNKDDPSVNLGIFYNNKNDNKNELRSGNFVGICRLKCYDENGAIRKVVYKDKEVILKIEPRFKNVSVVGMLKDVSLDEEFEAYLAPQSKKSNNDNKTEAEDTIRNELFWFSVDEDSVFIEEVAQSSSIITAANFLCMLKALCLRPLMGRMIAHEENLVGKVKGKILISKNIRTNTIRGRDDRIYCRYLRYSEDIPENQVLKAALKKATAVLNDYFNNTKTKKNTLMDIAGYCINSLSHISLTKISRQEISKLKPTGCYAYYKPVINLARMVLDEVTADASGQVQFPGYVVPYAVSMNRLYEMYARTYIKKHLPEKWRMMPYDHTIPVLKEHNDYYIGGTITPDIILYSPDENDLEHKKYKYTVLDVKYKRSDNKQYAREDRLQLLAYAFMYNCNKVGLIFPPNDGETKPKEKEACEINIQGGTDKKRTYIQIVLPIVDMGAKTSDTQNADRNPELRG